MTQLLPVGVPGGICSGLADVADGSGLVRLGHELIRLDADLYRLWRACAAAPTEGELVEWASDEQIAEPGAAIGELTDAGLLIDAQHTGIDALAIGLIGECVGNGADHIARFLVLGRDGSAVDVDPCSFEALLRCDGVTPMSVLCGELEAAQPEPRSGVYRSALAAGLPVLIRAGIVRLDQGGGAWRA